MTTNYKAEQVKLALERLQAAVAAGADSVTLAQASCDARLAGATLRQIRKVWSR